MAGSLDSKIIGCCFQPGAVYSLRPSALQREIILQFKIGSSGMSRFTDQMVSSPNQLQNRGEW